MTAFLTSPESRTQIRLSLLRMMKKAAPVLIVTAAALLILVPLFVRGIPKGGDLANHFHFALPFYDGLRSGDWYPGWLADSNWGYGDPRFRFYPPGLYYLLAATRVITGDWYHAAIVAFALLTIISAFGAYLWARQFAEPKIAACAGVMYLLAPYHLTELYQASLLSEYAASAVLPFAFLFVEKLCRERRARDIAGLGAAYALLVLTHLPLAVMGSLALLVYALIRIEKEKWRATVVRLALAVGLGLSASAFFWGTMLTELKWIKGHGLNPNIYYDYRYNFVFSPSSLTNLNNWYANLLAMAMIAFLVPAIIFTVRLFRTGQRGLKAVIILTFASLFMTTPLSRPVWAIVPRLSEIQFPWRWLAITSLAGSIILAISLPQCLSSLRLKLQPRKLAAGLVFALSLYYTGTVMINDSVSLKRPAFEELLQNLPGSLSFKDWTPVQASDLVHIQKLKSKVDAGTREINITSWEPERRTFHVAAGAESSALVWTYYYPRWTAFAGGQELPVRATDDGTMQVTLPSHAADVEIIFREPQSARIAAYLSAIAWLLIVALFSARWIGPMLRRRGDHFIPNKKPALINARVALE